MKKRLILLVILLIVLIVVIIASVGIINNLDKNNDNIQNNEQENIAPPEVQNEVNEEFVEILDNGIKQNTSSKLKEEKTINGLLIDNIDLFMSNGQTILRADVENKSDKDVGVTGINIILLNKDGSAYCIIPGVINAIKKGEKTKIEVPTTLDFSNAYDFKVELQ